MSDLPIIAYDNALRFGDTRPTPDRQMDLAGDELMQVGSETPVTTRATTATYIDKDTGLLATAAIDELRYERDPIDGVVRALIEGASQNDALHARDMTNAAWVKTNCTAAKDATGVDGTANAASTLTATGANATSLQTVTKASAENTFSIDIKRKTGTGAVEITVDGGTTWVAVTASISTAAWFRADVTQTLDNPIIGVRLVASGDEVLVDFGQLEEQPRATSRINTTTVAVARSADVVSLANTVIPVLANGATIEIEAAIPNDGTARYAFAVNVWAAGAYVLIRRLAGGDIGAYLGGVNLGTVAGVDALPHTYTLRTDGTTHELLIDGAPALSVTGALTQPTQPLYVGSRNGSVGLLDDLVGHLKIWQRYLTDAELTAKRSSYNLTSGLEQSGTFLTESWTWDCLRATFVTSSAVNSDIAAVFRVNGATPTHFILGAHRHDAAGFRLTTGTLSVDAYTAAGWVQIGTADLTTNASNISELIVFSAYTPIAVAGHYLYRMRIEGLVGDADYSIPELFLGEVLTMPGLSLPYDSAMEEWTGPSVTAETGRKYETSLSRRYMANAKFKYMDAAKAAEVNTFREQHIEERAPFWWFYAPVSDPTVGYMMKHNGKTATMPRVVKSLYDFTLEMIEAV